jgi:peroxiredoxin
MRGEKNKLRKVGSFFLNALALIAVFLVVATFQTRNMLATDGEAAPALQGVTLTGEPYNLVDAAQRPALVYFFAPWCKICGASADNLTRLRRWRDPADIEIVAVGLDWRSLEEVRDYVQRHELNVTVVLGNADVARAWKIRAFPSYYVLDSQHRIVRRDLGYSTQFGLWWRALTVS